MGKGWNPAAFGHVRATIRGSRPESFINRCVRDGVEIWDIKRIDDNQMVCSIALRDAKRLKPILKATDCRIHFNRRIGWPFFLSRLLSRSGITIGIILCLIILFILSNMVWTIQVSGADPKLEHNIRVILKKMKVHVGAVEFFLPPIENIEAELSSRLHQVTWVGVSKDGTTYHIDVVQKELPKKEKITGPRDLIATKTATIRNIYVEKGQAAVESDEVVKPGQLLVSGTIGNEDDPKFVSAKGKVIGETWYRSETKVPLHTEYQTFTGKTYVKKQLKLFNWHVPLWGWKKQPFNREEKEVVTKPFHFLFWDLPLAYKKVTYRETRMADRTLDEKQAEQIGIESARRHLLENLPKDSKIVSQDIRDKTLKDGMLKLDVFYTVLEDIAKPRSFLPQERKAKIEKEQKKKKEAPQGDQ
ncbi:sporulation protein YqfD [Camelliibacillus cellulosilyticus]|uniref:Sporulation protein YqfD n=1 Tax=Camelliibacillus cellulosilyticus TaxID=2174486 RepID=A0ABV9GM81_9BACL